MRWIRVTLRAGAAALFTVDEAYLLGAKDPMRSDDRCHDRALSGS